MLNVNIPTALKYQTLEGFYNYATPMYKKL